MNKTWAACESRAGAWLGAKGIRKSGRIPLSGSNSGTTYSDTPHPTIYCEAKRDKRYLSAIKLWEQYHKSHKKSINVLTLPTINDNKIVNKTSDIWLFHNSDSESINNHLSINSCDILLHPWKGNYPAVLSLYHEVISTWKNSHLDKSKLVAHCAIFNHGKKGFWIVINKNDISTWWELILEARIERNRLIDLENNIT